MNQERWSKIGIRLKVRLKMIEKFQGRYKINCDKLLDMHHNHNQVDKIKYTFSTKNLLEHLI